MKFLSDIAHCVNDKIVIKVVRVGHRREIYLQVKEQEEKFYNHE